MGSYFEKKISTLTCTICKRVIQDNGSEKISVIQFPKYLILYMGELNKKGLLKHPLKKTESAIDITVFADKDRFKSG